MAPQRGFSLVEVLVSLSLAALLLGSLYSAFAAVGRTNGSVLQAQRASQDQRLVGNALVELFANAVPMTESRNDSTHMLFEGRRTTLRFVSHLPAHAGGGGLQFVELHTEHSVGASQRSSLVLAFRAAWPDVAFDAPATAAEWSREVLLADVDSVEFEYFGADDARGRPRWRDSWNVDEHLPQLVRVAVRANAAWPELVVALRSQRSEAMPHWHRDGRRLR